MNIKNVIQKAGVIICVVLITAAVFFARGSCAYMLRDGENKANSAEAKSDFSPGEIIVRLKDGGTVQDLRELNSKYKVISSEPVFKADTNSQGVLDELKEELIKNNAAHDKWYWQTDASSKEYRDYTAKLDKEKEEIISRIKAQEELIARLALRQQRADAGEENVKLDNVYVLKTDAGTDVRQMVRDYADNPNVKYAELNRKVRVNMVPDDPYYSSGGSWEQDYDDLWGLKKINAEKAWDISQGESSIVAVIDTGVDYTHEDIKDNIWNNDGEIPGNNIDDDKNGYADDVRGWDFVGTSSNSAMQDNDPADGFGHGTHCAGIIAAAGNNGIGIIGVAPKARVMTVKGLDDSGCGYDTYLVKAIKYAVDNGADILSNSWGGDGESQLLSDAVAYAIGKGCLVVAAAGNNNNDASLYHLPNISGVIAVAATGQNDRKCHFSNWGERIDVAAPGGDDSGLDDYNVLSLLADISYLSNYYSELKVGSKYMRLAGTSMACPHVSGLAALLIDKYPTETNKSIRSRIITTADPLPKEKYYSEGKLGYGRVNAYRALTETTKPYFKISDIIVKEYSGDGDQILESGEKIKLIVKLDNVGKEAVKITSAISTGSKYVSGISNPKSLFSPLKGTAVLDNSSHPFIFTISNIRFETPVDFNLSINADGVAQSIKIKVILGVMQLPIKIYNVHNYDYKPIPRIFYYSIYKNRIVWHEFDDGNYFKDSAFYSYDLITKKKTRIPSISGVDRFYPWRYDNKLVWLENSGLETRKSGIYLCDIDTKKQTLINAFSFDPYLPVIYGDNIAWGRAADNTVYLKDLISKSSKKVENNFQYRKYMGFNFNHMAICKDKLAYSDSNYIRVYDTVKKTKKEIAGQQHLVYNLDINGNKVAWSDWTGGYGANIFLYDLGKNKLTQITDNSLESFIYAQYPQIDGDNLVWSDNNGIYLYQLDNGETVKVSSAREHPMISGNKIIWADNSKHFGWFDLYMTEIPDRTPPSVPVVKASGKYMGLSFFITANWSSVDNESGIAEYNYCIGSFKGGSDIVKWKSFGTIDSMPLTGLTVKKGVKYYLSVKARNGAGVWSKAGYSQAITTALP